jgi:hypothetical protein
MNTRILLLVFLFLATANTEVYSQFGFSHEIGVIAGPVAFNSDFGQRNDFETNSGNVSLGIGIIHYINFSYRADCNCYTSDTYFNDHFKIRNELNYHKTQLEHFGRWVDPDQTGLFADQLRAMKGSTRVIELGSQLEYFPMSIRDFTAGGYKIAPFVSLGAHYVSYDPEVYSELGELNIVGGPLATTPEKYRNAFQQEGGSTWALVTSAGIRYKLTPLSDLMLDARLTLYFSDWVDGLNPSIENNGTRPVPENKYNDAMIWLNFGYIYYLD